MTTKHELEDKEENAPSLTWGDRAIAKQNEYLGKRYPPPGPQRGGPYLVPRGKVGIYGKPIEKPLTKGP